MEEPMKKLYLKTLLLIAAAFLLLPVYGQTARKNDNQTDVHDGWGAVNNKTV